MGAVQTFFKHRSLNQHLNLFCSPIKAPEVQISCKTFSLLKQYLDPFHSRTIFNTPNFAHTPKVFIHILKNRILALLIFFDSLLKLSTPSPIYFMSVGRRYLKIPPPLQILAPFAPNNTHSMDFFSYVKSVNLSLFKIRCLKNLPTPFSNLRDQKQVVLNFPENPSKP